MVPANAADQLLLDCLQHQRDFQGNVDYCYDYLQPGKFRNVQRGR
jgi:hypothetical protein